MNTPFIERLRNHVETKQSRLCIGLDLDPAKDTVLHGDDLPSLKAASLAIVEATHTKVWGYKLNFAFCERFGAEGFAWLEELAAAISDKAMTIGDAKRGDIGNTAKNYAASIFEALNLDSATVNPYMGTDSLQPFIDDPVKGAFVLCLTSNPGAKDFQYIGGDDPLYLRVARWAEGLNANNNIGLVVGATRNEDIFNVRKAAPSLPFLVPGVGAQGGSLQAAVAGSGPGVPNIIPVSRGILYAGSGSLDDIVAAVDEYNNQINELI